MCTFTHRRIILDRSIRAYKVFGGVVEDCVTINIDSK